MRNADADATVTLNGVDLQVIDSGGDLPTVMLLHGLAGHAEEWDEVARCLTARHRVIAFDQRGQGRSTRRPDSPGVSNRPPRNTSTSSAQAQGFTLPTAVKAACMAKGVSSTTIWPK